MKPPGRHNSTPFSKRKGQGNSAGRLTVKGPFRYSASNNWRAGGATARGESFVAAGPVSRILSAGLLQQDGHSSGPNITVRLKRPTRRLWRTEPARTSGEPEIPSLFGLAPCGVCPARRITATAVRSYRTFSPLPRRYRQGGIFSVALSVE